MRKFPLTDERHFQAALGWLELGNWEEANAELENITPSLRAHPDVLQVRVKIFVAAEKWEAVLELGEALTSGLPNSAFGPLHSSEALRRLGQDGLSKDLLTRTAKLFPDEWRIAFALACANGKFGEKAEALIWLEKAIDLAGPLDIRMKALDEPDLHEIWTDISEI